MPYVFLADMGPLGITKRCGFMVGKWMCARQETVSKLCVTGSQTRQRLLSMKVGATLSSLHNTCC